MTNKQVGNKHMKKTIKKRNGTIVPFDKERIIHAIYKAMISVNEENPDIAKQIDGYERETSGSAVNRAISKIPFARESLPQKYNFVTGEPIKVEAYNFLFGARLKTGNFNSEMAEIERIVESGSGVTLSDPTRYGKLKDLPEIEKIQIRREFADSYSSAISKEMAKGSWDRKTNEDKAKTLNDLRSKILKKYK